MPATFCTATAYQVTFTETCKPDLRFFFSEVSVLSVVDARMGMQEGLNKIEINSSI